MADMYRFHESKDSFEKLQPPSAKIRGITRSGGIGPGATTEFETKVGPLWLGFKAIHIEHHGYGFTDVQEKGPFENWSHVHTFVETYRGVMLVERIEYEYPWYAMPIRAKLEARIAETMTWRRMIFARELGPEFES